MRCSQYVRHLKCEFIGQLHDVDVWLDCADGKQQCTPFTYWDAKEIIIFDTIAMAGYRFAINYPIRNVTLRGIDVSNLANFNVFLIFSVSHNKKHYQKYPTRTNME